MVKIAIIKWLKFLFFVWIFWTLVSRRNRFLVQLRPPRFIYRMSRTFRIMLQSIMSQDSLGPEGIITFRMIDTHFFKGTVPWGPCPAPFLASVTRQATILYAESSSTMLHNYVNHLCSGSQVHARRLRCQIVAVSLVSPGHWIQTAVTIE